MFAQCAQNVGIALKCFLFAFRLLIESEHVVLVASAHFKLLLKLSVFRFELCGFGSDYGQVSFIELAFAVAVLL